MRYRTLLLVFGVYAFAVCAIVLLSRLNAAALAPANGGPCHLPFGIQCFLPGGRMEDPDVARENPLITASEVNAIATIEHSPPSERNRQLVVLGKAEIFDRNLSVNKSLACASCHVTDSGFTNASSRLALALVDSPGAVKITNARGAHPNYRIGNRRPQTYGYAPFLRVLSYSASSKEFSGGNFWDFRATGLRLGNPAAEQAQGPPVNPNEMANPDSACLVYHLSTSRYAPFFSRVWGAQALAIHWPSDVKTVCARPGPPTAADPLPVHLSASDRQRVNLAFDHFADAIAAYEASSEVSPFSSKFDAFRAGQAQLTSQERRGLTLFNGKGKCATCHDDATKRSDVRIAGTLFTTTTKPLFTDQTSKNLGLPKNPELMFLYEDVPDQFGYTANPAGPNYTDLGVGGFLSNRSENSNAEWAALAPRFNGRFSVPTLRNVDLRPRPDFVKVYMHSGYLHSLAEVVHFYNTRDALPHCPTGSPGEKKTCWPPPETPAGIDKSVGNLHLTNSDEADVVAFLKALSDGYRPR